MCLNSYVYLYNSDVCLNNSDVYLYNSDVYLLIYLNNNGELGCVEEKMESWAMLS